MCFRADRTRQDERPCAHLQCSQILPWHFSPCCAPPSPMSSSLSLPSASARLLSGCLSQYRLSPVGRERTRIHGTQHCPAPCCAPRSPKSSSLSSPAHIRSSAVGLSVPVQAESCRERAQPHPWDSALPGPPSLWLGHSIDVAVVCHSFLQNNCGDAQGRSRLYTDLESLIWQNIDLRRRFCETPRCCLFRPCCKSLQPILSSPRSGIC